MMPLDFFAGNDRDQPVVPIDSRSTTPGSAPMRKAIVDRAVVGLTTAKDAGPGAPRWQPRCLAAMSQPAFTTGPWNQSEMTTLDLYSGNDGGKAAYPSLSKSRNRRAEPVQNEVVNQTLVGTTIDPLK